MADPGPLLNRLRFHLQRLESNPSSDEEWSRVQELAAGLILCRPTPGVRAAIEELRQAETFLAARCLPPNLVPLRRELDKSAAALARHGEPVPVAVPTDLERLREQLRGREVLVVGGDPREHHRENLEAELRSGRVHWPLTRESTPDVGALEPWVARGEVALVLLYIRFVRHAISDELPAICDRFGKPLARITAGYNPSKIAHEVLRQCSDRL